MIDQCLSTLIAEKYTTIQEDISQNSELDNLYSGLQNKQTMRILMQILPFNFGNLKNELQNLTTASRTTSLWLS